MGADVQKDFVIYCDMDGVLADFDAFYWANFGIWPYQCKDDRELWGRINQWRIKYKRTWFDELPVMKGADLLWNQPRNFNVAILTATGINPTDAIKEKTEWFKKHMDPRHNGCHMFFVQSGKDKAKYATPNSILIDDREKATRPWTDAGGISILHKNTEDTIKQLNEVIAKCFS